MGTINGYSDMLNLFILFNMGNGKFTNKTTYQINYIPDGLKIIDINNDNISDLIIIHLYHDFSIVLNKGNGIC